MGNVDGWITISTRVNNDQLEKDLKDVEKELRKYEKEEQVLIRAKSKIDLSGYDAERAKIKSNTDILLQKAETQKEVERILNREEIALNNLGFKYDAQLAKIESIEKQLKSNANNQKILNNRIAEMNNKLAKAKGFKNIGEQVKSLSGETSSLIGKVAKWAFALLSVRSAYNLIQKASSSLQTYNEQYATNMEYLTYILGQIFAPLLIWIQNLTFTILKYVGMILKAWFNIDIFANSSAKSFMDAKNNLKSANKESKELQKSLLGFDKLNILGDQKDADTSQAAIAPSVDLSGIQNIEVPEWIQWIMDNKEGILSFFIVLGTALAALKLGELASNLGLIGGNISIIKALGIGVTILGIIELVKELCSYFAKLDGNLENNGTTWEDFGGIVKAIGIILLGVGLIIGNIPVILAGAIAILVGLILKNWDKIKGTLQKAYDWTMEKLDWIENKFGWFGKVIVAPIKTAIDNIKNNFQGMFTAAKNILDGILLIFKGDFKNGFINIGKGILNAIIMIINGFINGVNLILSPIRALIVEAGSILGKNWSMSSVAIPTISYLATGGIINAPGVGVPIGYGARGGESGREGVLPLTNEQTMSELGREIGKHISINLDLTNSIDGRILSRVNRKINAERQFAMNGGM